MENLEIGKCRYPCASSVRAATELRRCAALLNLSRLARYHDSSILPFSIFNYCYCCRFLPLEQGCQPPYRPQYHTKDPVHLAVGDHHGNACVHAKPGGGDFGRHAARAVVAGTRRTSPPYGGFLPSILPTMSLIQLGLRVGARVGVVQAVDIREDNQQIGIAHACHDCGQRIVITRSSRCASARRLQPCRFR